MTTVDAMLQAACKKPSDSAARGALADALRETGDPELILLGNVVESEQGEELLKTTKSESKKLKLPLTAFLLWYVHHVMPRLPSVWSMPIPDRETEDPQPWGMPGASGVLPWRRVTGDPLPLPRRRRPGPWEARPPGDYDDSDHYLAIEAISFEIRGAKRP